MYQNLSNYTHLICADYYVSVIPHTAILKELKTNKKLDDMSSRLLAKQ